jgi:TM2 domain-containing membrane protein YozV
MTLLAILLPWLSFIIRGRILTGILCLLLQITIVGWIPAAAWAVISLNESRANRRTARIVKAINHQTRKAG